MAYCNRYFPYNPDPDNTFGFKAIFEQYQTHDPEPHAEDGPGGMPPAVIDKLIALLSVHSPSLQGEWADLALQWAVQSTDVR